MAKKIRRCFGGRNGGLDEEESIYNGKEMQQHFEISSGQKGCSVFLCG